MARRYIRPFSWFYAQRTHPGVLLLLLATKVGGTLAFRVKSTNVCLAQMGTKPATSRFRSRKPRLSRLSGLKINVFLFAHTLCTCMVT